MVAFQASLTGVRVSVSRQMGEACVFHKLSRIQGLTCPDTTLRGHFDLPRDDLAHQGFEICNS